MLKRGLSFSDTLRRRFRLLAVCALPAMGIGFQTPHGSVIATFIPACPGPGVAPSVKTKFAPGVRPAPRSRSSTVAVFSRGQGPGRAYQVLGEVGVLAHSSHTGVDQLTAYAKRAALDMGGDAIVDTWWDDAASVRPKAGEQGMLYLTASVVRWQ